MKSYKVVRYVRTNDGITTNESESMSYAAAMEKKASMMARDRYYDENVGYLKVKKWVYWLRNVSSETSIKVRLIRA